MMQKITLIAAHAHRYVIGRDNQLPWHLPEDFLFFKTYTTGKPIIMGRKTWESLPRKPLPNRQNIVITHQTDFVAQGAIVMPNLEQAIQFCTDAPEIIIMGGEQIYRQAMLFATDLRITQIDLNIDGDAFFPDISDDVWQIQTQENHISKNGLMYSLIHYTR